MTRLRLILILVSFAIACSWNHPVQAQTDRHPISNPRNAGDHPKRAWQIEYDDAHPRKENHAVRLIIDPADFEVNGSKPKVPITATLYQFGKPQGNPAKYEPKDLEKGGKISLSGAVARAPKNNGNTHWKKAGLEFELYGVYLDSKQKLRLVKVFGVYRPGRNNKKASTANEPDPRTDDSISLKIVEKELSENAPSLALPLASSPEQSDTEVARDRLALLTLQLIRLLNTIPCDDATPADAADEQVLEDPADPTIFTYTEEYMDPTP